MKRKVSPPSEFDVVYSYAESKDGRERYPKLRKALADIASLVGMAAVKDQIGASIQEILAYAKLDEPPRAPIETRALKRQRTTVLATGEAEDEEGGEEDEDEDEDEELEIELEVGQLETMVQAEVSRILMSMVGPGMAAGMCASDEEDEDEDGEWIGEETDEDDDECASSVPKALQGTKRHALIMGPTGCGKTTLAMRLARVWAAVGIVNNKFTAVSRGDIVSKWQGESVLRLRKLIKQHAHGVLFIDEAYALVSSSSDTFGNEVLTCVVKHMTDPKCSTTFILAGYETKIRKQLLASNEGLERRFAAVFTIAKPTNEDLADIFETVLKPGWKTTVKRADLAKIFETNPTLTKFNGGDVEHLVRQCERAHVARYFPHRMTRKIAYTDLVVAVKTFLEQKSRRAADLSHSGMYM